MATALLSCKNLSTSCLGGGGNSLVDGVTSWVFFMLMMLEPGVQGLAAEVEAPCIVVPPFSWIPVCILSVLLVALMCGVVVRAGIRGDVLIS